MPKMATKAADNVFYKARIAAASWNDRLGSREGASEVTGIDRTRLANIELGTINPHPEEVLMLSDTYNAPELQNHFCSHLCPLGIGTISPIELEELERVTLQLISAMKSLPEVKDGIIDIAADGVIDAKEKPRMERAEYNPRVELMPGDDEYEKLKRNIERFGMVVPVIWNRRTNRVVSGHQRLTVLMNEGVTEVDVSVVDLDETAEKQLNIAMNKVTGEWDEVKLKELLDGLGDAAPETGFDLYEIEALENNVDDLVDGDFLDSELKSIEETFNISLKFSAEDRDVLKEYIKDNGKEDLVAVIVQKIRGEI